MTMLMRTAIYHIHIEAPAYQCFALIAPFSYSRLVRILNNCGAHVILIENEVTSRETNARTDMFDMQSMLYTEHPRFFVNKYGRTSVNCQGRLVPRWFTQLEILE